MDNTFAARSARLSRDFPARSPPIHPRVPTTRPQQAESDSSAILETSQPIAQLPDHETASQLVQRLRIAPDLVQVYCSTHPSERPLFISQALLVQKSPLLLATAIQPPHHHHRDHHHSSIGPASLFPTLDLSAHSPNPTVLSIFIYWLFHSRVPDAAVVDVVSPNQTPHQHQHEQHQISLTHAWNFAKDWNLPLLQNEILKAFFRTLEEEEPLDAKTFETCLEISGAGSALRFALLAVLLWWDDLHEELLLGGSRRRGGREMLSDTIDIRGVEGFEEDFERALGVWEDEGRRRGRRYNAVDDVYVESRPWGRERPRAELFFV